MRTERVEKALKQIDKAELDFLLVTDPANQRYLTGLDNVLGVVLLGKSLAGGLTLATDARYAGFTDKIPTIICKQDEEFNKLTDLLKPGMILGFSPSLSHGSVERLKEICESRKIKLETAPDIIESLRAVKNLGELALMRTAAEITQAVFFWAIQKIKPGLPELDLALKISSTLREEAKTAEIAFPVIVASGPNAAIPHYSPEVGNRKIQAGDFITIDMGAVYYGYRADMTRTVVVGKPRFWQKRVYESVLKAQRRAARRIGPGMTGQEAYRIAFRSLERDGLDGKFTHGLGHGIGLEVHEAPTLTHREVGRNILEPGMCFSVEPGVYIKGRGGVRIEDTGVLTKDGFKSFYPDDKELIVV